MTRPALVLTVLFVVPFAITLYLRDLGDATRVVFGIWLACGIIGDLANWLHGWLSDRGYLVGPKK